MTMKTIEDIKNNNPFKVPDDYFDEVNRRIISATAEGPVEVRKKGLIRRLTPALAIAASAAVFIILSYSAIKVFSHSDQTRLISRVSTEELSATYLNDIDILALEENADPLEMYDNEPVATETEIIDFLLLENIDLNEIYEIL
jgi:hypothetical protein